MATTDICPDCGKEHDPQESFPEFYAELCDAAFRGFNPQWNADDGILHTSHEARTAANNVLLVLGSWGLNPFEDETEVSSELANVLSAN